MTYPQHLHDIWNGVLADDAVPAHSIIMEAMNRAAGSPAVRAIKTAEFTGDAIYALAAVWASIDGKLEKFAADTSDSAAGYRDGYMIEVEEAVKRLYTRGFKIVPIS